MGNEVELGHLETKRGELYPAVIKLWRDNRERFTEFFLYTKEIHHLIYIINIVEGCHRQIRKVTKNEGVFPSDMVLVKLVYLGFAENRGDFFMWLCVIMEGVVPCFYPMAVVLTLSEQ